MYEKSIDVLNKAVADEMWAVHQYMYFHFHCDDQGLDPLAALFKKTAIEEMLHIERMAERILFLKGEVEMEASREVEKIHDVSAILAKSIEMEQMSIKDYNRFANECAQNADSATKKIFEDLVVEEEAHFDNFDIQQEHIQKYGEQFLALQSFERGKSIGGPAGGGA
ncbi:MAG: ferritin-like domain-containing protein [Planctomycetota bacterium]|jgi:bacterioferritin